MTKRLPIFLLGLCIAGFLAGLFYLFNLRFAAGDVYAPYSSLRADPLGTMALYESLQKMPELTVARDYSPESKLPPDPSTAYLHLAAEPEEWMWVPEELAAELDRFVMRGGRLAITFLPQTRALRRFSIFSSTNFPPSARGPGPGRKSSGLPPGRKTAPGNTNAPPRQVSLRNTWGVDFGFQPLALGERGVGQSLRVENRTELPLPAELDWHSGLILTNLDASWRTIYARGGQPVMSERKIGAGAVVIATDSYFLSNEAMLRDRHADLLAWLVGSSRHVVFDEAHLGSVEELSVGVLMRKYRLHGMIFALVLLAGLFIWKNVVSFVPPAPREPGLDQVSGQAAAAGFVNLLRRNIPPGNVLRTCFDEWTRTLAHGANYSLTRVDKAQSVLEAENARPPIERNSIRAYREICKALKGKGTAR